MKTATTTSLWENYTVQQVGSVGRFAIFVFPGVLVPGTEDAYSKKTAERQEIDSPTGPDDIEVLELSKRYFQEEKASLLEKYKGKYVAILINRVLGSDKDFSKLATRIYEKFGYQTIYMPFVDTEDKVLRMPSPRLESS